MFQKMLIKKLTYFLFSQSFGVFQKGFTSGIKTFIKPFLGTTKKSEKLYLH